MAYTCTGFDKDYISKLRKRLVNKKVFNLVSSKNFMNYSDKLKSFWDSNYELKDKKLVIMGDGAGWIKTLALNLDAEYVLDKFHLVKTIKKICRYNKYAKKKILKKQQKLKKLFIMIF